MPPKRRHVGYTNRSLKLKNNKMIHKEIIQYFSWKNKISYQDSLDIHKRLEVFLINASNSAVGLTPTREIDEVWHNFILHTKFYDEYCQNNFGRFIHHNPRIPSSGFPSNLSCNTDDDDKCDSTVSKELKAIQLNPTFQSDCDSGDSCDSQVIVK